jgi:AMP-polyphosphate phosphotransferase
VSHEQVEIAEGIIHTLMARLREVLAATSGGPSKIVRGFRNEERNWRQKPMFESAELGHTLDKKTWDRKVPKLREALLEAQYELFEKRRFATVILVGGVDGAGTGETVNLLNEWMDPRHVHTHALGAPTDDEQRYPRWKRFWSALPPRGKVGIFFGSWYTLPIAQRVYGDTRQADLDQSLGEVVRFEQMLHAEGALVLKLWFHLSKQQQKKRFKALSSDKRTRWRVTDTDWKHLALYDAFRGVSERVLRHTNTAEAPWHPIEGLDARYRGYTAGTLLLEAMRGRLAADEVSPLRAHPVANTPPLPPFVSSVGADLLRSLAVPPKVTKAVYDERYAVLQARLNKLIRSKGLRKRAVVLAFEGPDAAGKGGAIRRVTRALDARHFSVHPVAAPSDEERAQPYLWRFWRHMPPLGHVGIFDRSWYGRVLVERVEKFCEPQDWQRAYSEINDFEEQLTRHGTIVAKFWLHIGQEEQLRRFKLREATGFKRFKITSEDWRNRDKWDDYEVGACDMFERTSTEIAPWTIVSANDKYNARLHVLETICNRLEKALEE